MAGLPEGTVTFLFSDIEGSTRLLQDLGDSYRGVLDTHRRLLREAFTRGTEVGTEGDSFFVVFPDAADAVAAAITAQRALAAEAWPAGHLVRVRMGLHTGRGDAAGEGYVGLDVHRAARIAAAGHGGQVLLSEATAELTRRELPEGASLRALGSHELKDLAAPERISQLVIAGLPSDFPPPHTIERARTNVRSPLTSFVGRERELTTIATLIDRHRLVTLVGTGGTGKTRLLLQTAGAVIDAWPDGVWLIELAPVTEPAQLLPAVARAIDVHEEPGRPLLEAVVDFLRPKHLLLLVDNCEHLIAPVATLVDRWLGEAPGVRVLATSREALGVDGEALFHVPSLPLPSSRTAPDRRAIDDAPATRLFVERATTAVSDFAPADTELAAIVDICRRLDGIPLAIELAAARVQVMSVGEIAERLGDRFRLLTGGARTAVARQQTLEAAIDWSWDLLTDHERLTMRRLAVFVGGCTVDAAGAVAMEPHDGAAAAAADALDVLGRLVAKSLLAVERGHPTRYRSLESIRQYARDRLLDAGESSVVRARHLGYFLALAEAAAPRLIGPGMADALRELDAERENLQAAADWAFETDLEAALRLCVALVVYGRARSLTTGFDLLVRAAERVEELPGWRTSPLAASVLAGAANAAWMVGSPSRGDVWATAAVDIARASGDRRAVATALIAQAMTSMFLVRSDGILDQVIEASVIADELGEDHAVAFAYGGVAQWQAEAADMTAAVESLERAEIAAERSGSPEAIAFSALGRGRVAGFAGRLDEARQAFGRAIEAYEAIEDDSLALIVRSDLAHALRQNGEPAEAAATYRRTLPAWERSGNRGAIANQLESVALLAASTRPAAAVRLLAAGGVIRVAAQSPMLPFEQEEVDTAMTTLRPDLSDEAFAAAERDGRRLDIAAAVADAMALLDDAERDVSRAVGPASPPPEAAPGSR